MNFEGEVDIQTCMMLCVWQIRCELLMEQEVKFNDGIILSLCTWLYVLCVKTYIQPYRNNENSHGCVQKS